MDPEVSRKFHEFREQTKKHETILMNAIRALSMDPDYMSPAAKLAEQKAAALLNTMTNPNGLPSAAVQLNALENVILAETKDHADWELLVR